MKKMYMILILAFVFLLMNVGYSQINVGIIGGINLSTLSGEDETGESIDFKSRTGFGIGGILDLTLGQSVSLVFQPMYLQKGADFSEEGDDIFDEVKLIFKTTYLEVPALFRITLGSGTTKVYFLGGPSVGINLSSDLEVTAFGLSVEADIGELTESIDLGLQFGGGLSLPLGNNTLFVEAKYALGITDILKDGTFNLVDEEVEFEGIMKTRGILIMGGISFPIGNQ